MNTQTFLRKECKYLLTKEQAQELYLLIKSYITPDIYPEYDLNNIYYDDEEFSIINRCLNSNGGYKEKVRVRSYGSPDSESIVFIELKKKSKGWGEKRRFNIKYKDLDSYLKNKNGESQVEREINYVLNKYNLSPKVFISYHRQAFDSDDIRITFDTDIRFRVNGVNLNNKDEDIALLDENTVLLEIKTSSCYPLWLIRALEKVGAKQTSFSKYGEIYKNYIYNRDNNCYNINMKGI